MKTVKRSLLKDGNGNKLSRKIRQDHAGLYVINHGMKGRLVKTVISYACGDYWVIRVHRQVDYYES